MAAGLIPFTGLTESPWRNGAGRKADIAAGPGWLMGFAWLDTDAAFSDYTGHDRTIVLIAGAGFALDFGPSHPELVVRQPDTPCAFDGGWPACCRLLDGPCVVLNAMTSRATGTHTVTVSPAPAQVTPAPGEKVFVVVLAGRVSIGDAAAAPRDTFVIGEAAALRAEAAARVALVRIRPRPGA